jgi:hypothetical protein
VNTTDPQPATPVPPAADRAALSAKLWEIAEHHIVAEWICCEPLEPGHKLCSKGHAALGMAKTLLVDGDPEKVWNPSAPLLDAVLDLLRPAPADQAALRELVAAAIYEHMHPGSYWSDTSMPAAWRLTYLDEADAVLSVLPASVDRAATLWELEQCYRPNTPPSRPEPRIPDHTVNEEEAPTPVKQRADCTELEWAEQERARFERLYTRETVRADLAEQRADTAARDADIYQKRLERLSDGYTKQRKRADQAEADAEQLRTGRAAVCICAHAEAQHFEDACLVCDCGDFLIPEAAREMIARWRMAATQAGTDRSAVLREAADRYQGFIDNADTDADPRYWTGIRDMVIGLRHMAAEPADETPQPTPCDQPNPCEDGELCATHEEEQAHAEGEHAFCGPTCEVEFPSDKLRNTILYRAIPGSAGMLDELLRRMAAETPRAGRDCPACGARIKHTVHCPTPESHNWGCGCPGDRLPLYSDRGVDTPGCDCGHKGKGMRWHGETCGWIKQLTEEARALLAEPEPPTVPPVHVGGNAEDCPGCEGSNPDYPFICPGPPAVPAQPAKEA